MVFLFLVIIILILLHGYVGFRIIPALHLSHGLNLTAWVLVGILTFLPLVPILLRMKGLENPFIDKLSWVGYFSLGFFTLAFIFILGSDLLLGMGSGIARIVNWMTRAEQSSPGTLNALADPQRRLFFQEALYLGMMGFTAGLSLWGLFEARRRATVFHITIPISELPRDLEGFRIVQLSDIHVGPTIKRDYVQRIVDQTLNLKPDMIALTGDLVDGSVTYLHDELRPLLQLEAPFGKFFVTGNHEYYSGVHRWIPVVESLGFTPLINAHQVITVGTTPVTVAGITDITANQMDPENRSDPEKALQGAPEASLKILLAHQPRSIEEAARLNVDLQLSGHTHGGQFKPFHFAVKHAHPYIAGLHRHNGTWIYVNRGTGYWGPPLRLGIPSEITVLTLTRS